MKNIFIVIALLAVSACGTRDYQADASRQCSNNWKGTGLDTRILTTHTDGRLSSSTTYSCQVQVKGKWFPEESVHVTP